MIFQETPLAGASVLDLEPIRDERGFFARTFCADELAEHGLGMAIIQSNVSFNPRRGTLRGMHLQIGSAAEIKLIRCTAGAVFDVIVDVRRDSATFGGWYGTELSASNRRALWVPEGFAHGFLTLQDDSELHYDISARWSAEHSRALRWDDPAVGIDWPFVPMVISERDRVAALLGELDLG